MVANNEDCNDDKLLINIRSSWHAFTYVTCGSYLAYFENANNFLHIDFLHNVMRY